LPTIGCAAVMKPCDGVVSAHTALTGFTAAARQIACKQRSYALRADAGRAVFPFLILAEAVGARLAREVHSTVHQVNRISSFPGKPRSNKIGVRSVSCGYARR
jgi:hypothetical protein